MITALTKDAGRNQLIANDVVGFTQASPGPALVVSDRKTHCGVLADLIRERGVKVALLTGDTRPKARGQIIDDLRAGNLDVLVATIQLIGEGVRLQESCWTVFGNTFQVCSKAPAVGWSGSQI